MFWFRRRRPAAGFPKTIEVVGWAQTDPGKVRERNEDAVFFGRSTNTRKSHDGSVLAMVADGMGGANGGSIASGIVSSEVAEVYMSTGGTVPETLRRAFESANRRIYRRSHGEEGLRGMGSTCVALVVKPPLAWAAWVGDSRLYLMRNGQIFQMTHDHSLVAEMVRRGMMSSQEAHTHEVRNVITRALGTHSKVQVDVWQEPYPVRAGDRFLLCSDGLHDLLASDEILGLAGEGGIEMAVARLIAEATARGGFDNISAVLVDIVEPDARPALDARPTRECEAQDVQEIHKQEQNPEENSGPGEMTGGSREENLELAPRIES